MKTKLICLLVFLLNIYTASAQQKTVYLSGSLINFSNEVEVEDLSEYQYLNIPTTTRLITPSSSGKFEIRFELAAPNYFRIGRNILYLSPGDSLKVTIYKNNEANSSFSGIGQNANKYLRETPFPKGGSYLEAGRVIAPEPKETLESIMAAAKDRGDKLTQLNNVSPEFKRLEKARIKADVLNSFNSIEVYARHASGIGYYPFVYAQMLNKLAKNIRDQYQQNFIDASFMKLVVYRDVVKDLMKDDKPNDERTKIEDWYKATALVEKINNENDKTLLNGFYKNIDEIKTPGYNAATKAYLQNQLHFGKGDMAVNFTAIDVSGHKVNLADLKGKVIYIDLWATWCGPCLNEMPKFDEIKDQYRNDPKVVFLSLSIDDDNQLQRWRQNMAGRDAKGLQWQVNRNKLMAYNITTIPRALLIDKDFNMVSMNAPLPSSNNLSAIIDKLLTK
jgi:thiol-disulfide isomerase/thioredoxin